MSPEDFAFRLQCHPAFSEFEDLAREYVLEPGRDTFYEGRTKPLRAAVEAHRERFAQPNPRGVVLVHQFWGRNKDLAEYAQYVENIKRLYALPITLFETVQEYPFSAAHLLEAGLVKDVQLTWMTRGYPLKKGHPARFIAGSYGDACVLQAAQATTTALPECILNKDGTINNHIFKNEEKLLSLSLDALLTNCRSA